jgi:hypothetical protein
MCYALANPVFYERVIVSCPILFHHITPLPALPPSLLHITSQVFAGLFSLDPEEAANGEAELQRTLQAASSASEKYVLKPQREGGGNNIYNEVMMA